MIKECPCRYCEKRDSLCHGSCEEYLDWADENAKIRKRKNESARINVLAYNEKRRKKR